MLMRDASQQTECLYTAITFMLAFKLARKAVHIEDRRLISHVPRCPSSPLTAPVRPDSSVKLAFRPPHTSYWEL